MSAFRVSGYVLLLLASATALPAQSLLRGRVATADSTGLGAVHIQLTDSAARVRLETTSDSTGEFRIYISRGAKTELFFLSASVLGYEPIERSPLRIKQGESVAVDVHMVIAPAQLAPVNVIARRRYTPGVLHEFHERAQRTERTGLGRVLNRSELESMPHMNLVRAVSQYAGVRYTPVSNGGFISETITMRGGCRPAVFLDRIQLAAEDYSHVLTTDLEGVEIYRGPEEVPPEYAARAGTCGAILAWSRVDVSGSPLTWKRVGVAAGLVLFILIL